MEQVSFITYPSSIPDFVFTDTETVQAFLKNHSDIFSPLVMLERVARNFFPDAILSIRPGSHDGGVSTTHLVVRLRTGMETEAAQERFEQLKDQFWTAASAPFSDRITLILRLS